MDKHLLVKDLKICNRGQIKLDKVDMFDAIITLVDIIDRFPDIYNTNERWVVKRMMLEHANRIVAILPIIY